MRNGLCVWAKACKCQTLFPRKVPRPATSSFKLATFSRLETLAVYSRTSPARRGNAVSTGAAAFFETAGRRGLPAAALAGFAGGGASRNPAGGGIRPPARAALHVHADSRRRLQRRQARPVPRRRRWS